ncbi:MAG: ABC transporter ATP-binding protein, partial [Flavobacteriaceae bacterium]
KTVFLKSLIGLHQPDSGRIAFDGVYLDELERNEQRELRKAMGMVFQGSALFDSMTVAENVCFPLQMFTTYSAKEKKEQVDRVLDRVNLIDAHHKYPAELSGGMKKRVAIARAIVMNPKYLFCDEPNSGLDPRTAILIDDLIQEITREYDITTLINTHDMNSVMQIGEKIVFLKEGKLAWQGTKEEIFVTDNQAISEFVYASELYKNVRKVYQEKSNLAP